jgi:protein-S-isoprenylcysteine O-methyltransferase Ste14
MARKLLREMSMEISFIIFMCGLLLFLIGMFGVFFPESTPIVLDELVRPFDETNWDSWAFFIGLLLTLGGGWVFVDKAKKLHEFNKLVNTTSKASFVRNLDRIEYLAWKLTSKQEEIVESKRKYWRL